MVREKIADFQVNHAAGRGPIFFRREKGSTNQSSGTGQRVSLHAFLPLLRPLLCNPYFSVSVHLWPSLGIKVTTLLRRILRSVCIPFLLLHRTQAFG